MRSLSLAVLTFLGATGALAAADSLRPCGFKIAPCPLGQVCQKVDPSCDRGDNCQGYCAPAPKTTLVTKTTASPPKPTSSYTFCGGIAAIPCAGDGEICIDDPRDTCDPKHGGADCGGICVKPVFCGGFAGIACDGGKKCVDDPRDDCDPTKGGADCGGICV